MEANKVKQGSMGASRTRSIAFVALTIALLGVSAWVSIPIGPVPISLTNFAIYLSLYLLDWKKGTISYFIYLLLGFAGLPVFSGFTGGVAKLAGPTGGYIVGFIPMAIIAGFVIDHCKKRWVQLVGMIVGKAVQMAQMMHVPILGLVENMSYAVCPDCGKHINVFGEIHVDEIADKYKLPVLAKMPIDPELAKEADAGMIEMFAGDYLDNAAQTVAKLLKK